MTDAWKILITALKKERLMTTSNIIVMVITFLLLGIFINTVVFSQTALKYLENQAQITLFFKDDYQEDKIKALMDNLKADKRISGVNYVSKEDALRIFKEINKDEPILLESISASILPASLEIKAKNISDLESLTNEFNSLEGVEDVRFFKDVVVAFRLWSNVIYIVGFVLVAVFFLISYSVIIAALRTTINARGTELEIMKLVGASDSYVKNPLLYQGIYFGLVSSGISAIVMVVFGVVVSKANLFPQGLSLGFIPGFYVNPIIYSVVLAFILILSGLLLGYFGSNTAIKKYLKY